MRTWGTLQIWIIFVRQRSDPTLEQTNKMWEKTQRSLWLAPKRDDLIDFYECHTKGHNELARLSSDGGSAFLCSKLQIHFILQIKRLSQKRVKSESKTTNSSKRFLVMGCISFVKYIQRICFALNTYKSNNFCVF